MLKKKVSLWITLVMSFVICIGMFTPVSLNAASLPINVSKKGILHVDFKPGVATFKLYKVASVDAQLQFTMDDSFAQYYTTDTTDAVNGLNTTGYRQLTSRLRGLIHQYGINPMQTIETDDAGWGTFHEVPAGMYLVLKAHSVHGDEVYQENAEMVVMPSVDLNKDEWSYELIMTPKVIPEAYLVDEIVVEKQWDFSSAEDPEQAKGDYEKEIAVQLLVDPGDGSDQWSIYEDGSGTDYSNIILNQENNWRQEFTNMGLADGSWMFVEADMLDNFDVESVTTTENQSVTLITNRYIEPNDTSEEEEGEDTTEEESTTEDNKTTTTTTTPSGGDTTNSKLPQTGQLWWPVGVLGGLGFLLILLGALKNIAYRSR